MSVPDLKPALLILCGCPCKNLNLGRSRLLGVMSTATSFLVVYTVVSQVCVMISPGYTLVYPLSEVMIVTISVATTDIVNIMIATGIFTN